MKKTIFLSALLITIFSSAQSLRVSEWRDHLPYSNATQVCKVGEIIYVSTDKALFGYNKSDKSIHRINTLNGLSDIGVSSIESYKNSLIIGYENGNIDLFQSGKSINIPEIKRSSIVGNKAINHIEPIGDDIYLSCGFGVVVLDAKKQEIKDTYYLSQNGGYVNVLFTGKIGDRIFALTENDFFSADINHPNLANFNVWEKVSIPSSERINLLETFGDKLIINFQKKNENSPNTDTLYQFDGADWIPLNQGNYTNKSIRAIEENLIIVRPSGVSILDQELNQTRHLSMSAFALESGSFSDAIYYNKNEYWIADNKNGLLHSNQRVVEFIKPSGPFESDVVQIKNFGDEIWLSHGAMDENWAPTWNKTEASWLAIDDWGIATSFLEEEFTDIVALNKRGEETYFASWHNGLAKMVNQQIEIYNETNSSLQKRAIYEDWILIGDIQFDSKGNMWCTNSQTREPLSVQYLNGEWESFPLGVGITESQSLSKLLIDKNDQKWIQLKEGGIVVFDESNSGVKARKLSVGETTGNLASNKVHSFAEDLDGKIWVGTDNGISVFSNPEFIFTGENASKIMVTLDEYTTYLLDGQRVNDIEVDGANRKWFALNNSGVVVTSENGTEEIHHFTAENSPLFSNKIIDIEFNDLSGEVFIATDKGLISYRSGATEGKDDFSSVLVFPNPVKPGYDGLITIKGLISNAVVKITDVSGNLVYETTALGGQATWDGANFDGRRVQTGVYFVFCSDDEGNVNHVDKILFIQG